MNATGTAASRLSADEFRLLRWGLGALLSVLGAAANTSAISTVASISM